MTIIYDTLLVNANLATMRAEADAPYGTIENTSLAIKDGQIAAIGEDAQARSVIDCKGGWVTPGLVDCHTHLIFAKTRAIEREMRLQGASYEDIAKAGGGILSTVKAVRAASFDALLTSAQDRLSAMMKDGITTAEIKSGYGLDLENEGKMLRVAARLGEGNIRIQKTFLGAHALPPEYKHDPDGYIDMVCAVMIPQIAKYGLADAVDGFCENIGFTPAQIERVFKAAQEHGLPVKLHAEQLSNLGGAKLAAKYKALSADHLEYLDEAGVKAMSDANMIAVMLPGAYYYLNESQTPPIDLFRQYNVPMAVASDCNPGTSPMTSPTLAMNMACTEFGLTPEEALAGMTRCGAQALGLEMKIGTLEVGKCADMLLWDIDHPSEISYWIGMYKHPKRFMAGALS